MGAGIRLTDNLELNTLFEISPYNSVHSNGQPSDYSAQFGKYSARQFLIHLGVGYAF